MKAHLQPPYDEAYSRLLSVIKSVREQHQGTSIADFRVRVVGSRVWLQTAIEHAEGVNNSVLAEKLRKLLEGTDCDIRIEYCGDKPLTTEAFKSAVMTFQSAIQPGFKPGREIPDTFYTAKDIPGFPADFEVSYQPQSIAPRSNMDAYIGESGELEFENEKHQASFWHFINNKEIETYDLGTLIATGTYDLKQDSNLANCMKSYVKPLSLGWQFHPETAIAIHTLFNSNRFSAKREQIQRHYGRLYIGKQPDYTTYVEKVESEFGVFTTFVNEHILTQTNDLMKLCEDEKNAMLVFESAIASSSGDDVTSWLDNKSTLNLRFTELVSKQTSRTIDDVIKLSADIRKHIAAANAIIQNRDTDAKKSMAAHAISAPQEGKAKEPASKKKKKKKAASLDSKDGASSGLDNLEGRELERILQETPVGRTDNPDDAFLERFANGAKSSERLKKLLKPSNQSRINNLFPDGISGHTLHVFLRNNLSLLKEPDAISGCDFSTLHSLYAQYNTAIGAVDDDAEIIEQVVSAHLIENETLPDNAVSRFISTLRLAGRFDDAQAYERFCHIGNAPAVASCGASILSLMLRLLASDKPRGITKHAALRKQIMSINERVLGESRTEDGVFFAGLFSAVRKLKATNQDDYKLFQYLYLGYEAQDEIKRIISDAGSEEAIHETLLNYFTSFILGTNPLGLNWDVSEVSEAKFYELMIEVAQFAYTAFSFEQIKLFKIFLCNNIGKERVSALYQHYHQTHILSSDQIQSEIVEAMLVMPGLSGTSREATAGIVKGIFSAINLSSRFKIFQNNDEEYLSFIINLFKQHGILTSRTHNPTMYLKAIRDYISDNASRLPQSMTKSSSCLHEALDFFEKAVKLGGRDSEIYKMFIRSKAVFKRVDLEVNDENVKTQLFKHVDHIRRVYEMYNECNSLINSYLYFLSQILIADDKFDTNDMLSITELVKSMQDAASTSSLPIYSSFFSHHDLRIPTKFVEDKLIEAFIVTSNRTSKLSRDYAKNFPRVMKEISSQMLADGYSPHIIFESSAYAISNIRKGWDKKIARGLDTFIAHIANLLHSCTYQYDHKAKGEPTTDTDMAYIEYYSQILLAKNPYSIDWKPTDFVAFFKMLESMFKLGCQNADMMSKQDKQAGLDTNWEPYHHQSTRMLRFIQSRDGIPVLHQIFQKHVASPSSSTKSTVQLLRKAKGKDNAEAKAAQQIPTGAKQHEVERINGILSQARA